MNCMDEDEPMYCPFCQQPLGRQDRIFILPSGEMGYEACVTVQRAGEMDWQDWR